MARSGFVAFVVILVLAAGAVFVSQNMTNTVPVVFDLGRLVGRPAGTWAAWYLVKPAVEVPVLAGIFFAAGLAVGIGMAVPRMLRQSSRIRQLEQQAAAGSVFASGKEPGSW